MIFDDEERDSKFMEAMRLLVDCVEDNADYLLLIAMIRMFGRFLRNRFSRFPYLCFTKLNVKNSKTARVGEKS